MAGPSEDTRQSIGSSTIDGGAIEHMRRQRSHELGEPSEKQYRRAGMAGTTVSGAGAAGSMALITGHDHEPRGWREVAVDDKHHVWSGHISGARSSALKVSSDVRPWNGTGSWQKVLLLFALITVWLWICLPIFWGSTYLLTEHFPNLEIHLVSFDTAANSYLNGPMTEMAHMQASLPKQEVHLGWTVRGASDYPNGVSDVEANVLSQRSWATVVINANATTAWTQAVQNGDASYDPTGAITVYLQSARFYQVTLLYIEQLVCRRSAGERYKS
jgi:hypothetical protein